MTRNDDLVDRLARRAWLNGLLARLGLLIMTTTTAGLGSFSGVSLTGRIFAQSGMAGAALEAILWALLAVAWLDVVINDFLPERITWRAAKRCRWVVYWTFGTIYAVFAAGSVTDDALRLDGAWILITNYFCVAALACAAGAVMSRGPINARGS